MYTKNFSGKGEWVPGVISKVQGSLSYLISLEDGRVVHRHVDHIKLRETMFGQLSCPVDQQETTNAEEANTDVEL